MTLADPAEQPLLRVDDLLGLLPGTKRSALYDAVRRGDLPSLRIGRRVMIPNLALREHLHLPLQGVLATGAES